MSHKPILAHKSGARRWYGGLINLYPGAFREHYAAEMIRVFEESSSRVGDRGAIARWRYWLHVLFDLVRTLPGEWLAAMPAPTIVGLFAIGVPVFLCIMDHQWLTLANWLMLCPFTIICRVLIRPSRLGLALSLLLTGAGVWAGFWITKSLPKFIPGSLDHGQSDVLECLTIMTMMLFLFCQKVLKERYPKWNESRKAAMRNRRPGFFLRQIGALCLVGPIAAQLFFLTDSGVRDQMFTAYIVNFSCIHVFGQLSVIWRSQDPARKPDSETRPA